MADEPTRGAVSTDLPVVHEITREAVGLVSAAASALTEGDVPGNPRILSLRELLLVKPKDWLVEGVLQHGDMAVLYGPSGEGKTFVALDLALSIAAGTRWHGHTVRVGSVVFLAAEGARGLRNRVRAWAGARLEDPNDLLWRSFHCIASAVQLRTDLDALLCELARLDPKPSLIVVDTMARCIVGLEENSAKEMGEAIHDCGRLQEATGANVLLVHHTGKGDGRDTERGSSAIRAAADTMILVNRDVAGLVHVEVTKQKEAEGGEEILLKLDRVDLGVREDGSPESSCRLSLARPETGVPESHPELNAHGLKLCLTLRESFLEEGAPAAQLKETGSLPRSSFYRELKTLVTKGYIQKVGNGNRSRYVLTGKFQQGAVP